MKNASPGSEESPARQSLPYGGPAMAWVDSSEYLPIMEWDLCPAPFFICAKGTRFRWTQIREGNHRSDLRILSPGGYDKNAYLIFQRVDKLLFDDFRTHCVLTVGEALI